MKNETLTFSDLRRGQKFVVLPSKEYVVRRDGDYLKANYLFLKIGGRGDNAVRICDGRTCTIPENVPVFRVQDSGRAAGKRRRR